MVWYARFVSPFRKLFLLAIGCNVFGNWSWVSFMGELQVMNCCCCFVGVRRDIVLVAELVGYIVGYIVGYFLETLKAEVVGDKRWSWNILWIISRASTILIEVDVI